MGSESDRYVITLDSSAFDRELDRLDKRLDEMADKMRDMKFGGDGSNVGPNGYPRPNLGGTGGGSTGGVGGGGAGGYSGEGRAEIGKDILEAIREASSQGARDSLRRNRDEKDQRDHESRLMRGKEKARRQMAFGAMAMGGGALATGIAGGAGSITGVMSGIGAIVKGATSIVSGILNTTLEGAAAGGSVGGGTGAAVGGVVGLVSSIISGGGTAAAVGLAGAGMLTSQRYEVANQYADYQRGGMYAPLSGVRYNMRSGVSLGMSPNEAAQQASAASLAAGVKGSMRGVDIFQGMSYGMSASGIGNLAGTAAYGTGNSKSFVMNSIAAGVQQGLRGSKLEQFTGVLANTIGQAGEAGVQMDVGEFGKMTAGISSAIGPGNGMYAANIASTAGSLPGQVKQSLTQQFAPLGQALVLAEAAKSGGGLGGLMTALEGMGLEDTMRALGKGGIAGQMVLAGSAPFDMAGDALGASATNLHLGHGVSAGAAAQARATQQANLLGTMTEEKAIELINAVGNLQVSIQRLTDGLGIPKLVIFLETKITELVDAVRGVL